MGVNISFFLFPKAQVISLGLLTNVPFIHLFIQQLFNKGLVYTKHCTGYFLLGS